jgi:hypothetical protein
MDGDVHCEVDRKLPLLISSQSVKNAGIRVDLENETVDIRRLNIYDAPLIRTQTHSAVSVLRLRLGKLEYVAWLGVKGAESLEALYVEAKRLDRHNKLRADPSSFIKEASRNYPLYLLYEKGRDRAPPPPCREGWRLETLGNREPSVGRSAGEADAKVEAPESKTA